MGFKVLEASANDIRLRNKFFMSFIDTHQVDFRAAIPVSRDPKVLGCLVLQTIEVTPSPWVGAKQLDEGQAFLEVSLKQRWIFIVWVL